jgi:hypothetical protein
MMKTMTKIWTTGALCSAMLLGSAVAMAQAVVGQPAPAIAATDASGKPVSLADYKGKYVVLEWTNPECPFVKKHYDGGNMPATQKQAIADGAVWLTVQTMATDGDNSAAYAGLQSWQKSKNATPTKTIVDSTGAVGHAYGARTTPHMYIVDPNGQLIYAGAIDSKPSTNPDDIKGATNYVSQSLAEAMAGKPVSRPTTQAYGCSVKYPSAS